MLAGRLNAMLRRFGACSEEFDKHLQHVWLHTATFENDSSDTDFFMKMV